MLIYGFLALCLLWLAAYLRAGVFQAGGLTKEAGLIATDMATWKMHLYVSNITPTTSTTLATLVAAEATFTGYAAQTVGGCTVGSITSDSIPIAQPQLTFANSGTGGSDQVYGYYLTDSTNATLYAAELLSGGPFAMATNGDTLKITVTETLTRV